VLQQIGMWVLSGLLVLALAFWSTRAVNPLWPAAVFALARAGISFGTGATPLTTFWTAVAAVFFGALYFWVLQRTQGKLLWWFVLVVGVVLFSI
jgi:hypothetical protein